MTIDMKFFNVYYFCHLANESMGKFDYASTNAEFTERQFEIEPEEFPPISVLREYCSWLIDRIFYEQANSIANSGEVADFNPINWINQAVLKYKGIDVLLNNEFKSDNEDYLETYNKYIEYLDRFVNGLFYDVIYDIAIEVEYILFQNRDFLLRFNEQQAAAFEDHPRKRVYMPEWVKRAVLFRDKGCCVFCKKDLTGLYSLLEDNEKHFDHIVPLNEGGLNDVCNIQLACQDCNLKKSDRSGTSTLYQSAY
ncbi:hypothetical protein HNQ56_003460 [Anaerotaenia torta]|uniref:HNH endonuclease n=1 Tax=Anaerotaenia torta TaxID=433293 RepID=UPI003D1A8E5F